MYVLLLFTTVCNTAPLFIGHKHGQFSHSHPTVPCSSLLHPLPFFSFPAVQSHCPVSYSSSQWTFCSPANFPNPKAASLLPAPLSLPTYGLCVSSSNRCYLQRLVLFLPPLLAPAYYWVLCDSPSTLPAEVLSDAHTHADFTHHSECGYIAHRPHEAQRAGERSAHLHAREPFSSCSNMPGSAGSETAFCWLHRNCPTANVMSHVGSFLCPVHCGLNSKYQSITCPSLPVGKREETVSSPVPRLTVCSLTK